MGFPKDLIEDWLIQKVYKYNPMLIEAPRNGTRKVSGQLLSPPDSAHESSRSAPTHNAFAVSHAAAEEIKDLEIPVSMYSKEALQFVGFDLQTSCRLLDSWLRDPAEERTFQDLVLGYLDEASLPSSKDWVSQMTEIGISREMQAGIMDPMHTDVRATNTLRFWLQHFVFENLLILETLNQRIESGLKIMQTGLPQLRGGGQDRSDYHLRQAGHTTLYRATSVSRLAHVFKNGALHLERMCMGQPAPSDFSLDRTAYYWSPQHWVAEKFALYTQRNCKIPGDVAILRILCPSFHLDGPSVWKLESSDEWQKLVWHSRRQELYPTEIQAKWDRSQIVIGPVSIDRDQEFANMKSWTQVAENNMLKKGSEIGMQYVWLGAVAMAQLNKAVEEKLDLFKCFHPNTPGSYSAIKWIPDFEQWVDNRLTLERQ